MTALQLRAARDALGMTQAQFAEAIGVHRVTVARMETGVRVITRRTAGQVAALVERGEK